MPVHVEEHARQNGDTHTSTGETHSAGERAANSTADAAVNERLEEAEGDTEDSVSEPIEGTIGQEEKDDQPSTTDGEDNEPSEELIVISGYVYDENNRNNPSLGAAWNK